MLHARSSMIDSLPHRELDYSDVDIQDLPSTIPRLVLYNSTGFAFQVRIFSLLHLNVKAVHVHQNDYFASRVWKRHLHEILIFSNYIALR